MMSLILCALFIILCFVKANPYCVGIYKGCSWIGNFAYPFFHGNILHAMCNSWAVLSVVFVFNVSLRRLILCYLIAVFCPPFILSDIPAIGASGMCYALFGSVVFLVSRKVYFVCYFLCFIALGIAFRNAAVLIHLYCFSAGILFGLLNAPIYGKDNHTDN